MKKYSGITTLLLFLCIPITLHAATIHGFVREQGSREPILMANVWIKDTSIGTTTNMKGYYVISNLPPGKYEVYFRYIGYQTHIEIFELGQTDDITKDIDLKQGTIEVEGMEIVAKRDKRELDIKPSAISMSAIRMKNIPGVAEPDLFRALQMLPGVATLSDYSAGLYIRGGSPDQNLILLDHIDVYNPNHMFGFFSTFNTDAIKSVELLKGGYPAQYGGRLSSALNVLNKEGNRQEFQGVARLSLLSTSATLEGPWKKGSWMVSGRRTYLDLASKMVDMEIPYYFYDGHAKINYDIDKNNQASVSFYIGNDLFNLDNEGMSVKLDWGNRSFSSQWTHLFSSKLFSHFVFAGSRFNSDTQVQFDQVKFGILNQITDLALKGELTYTPNLKHSIDLGFDAKALDFKLNYHVVDTDYKNEFKGNYLSIYLQDNIKLSPLTVLQTGARLDHYTDGGYTRFDPRFSIKRIISDRNSFTLTYGRYHQFLNLVHVEGFSFADMWFPVDPTFDPGEADQYIIGYTYDNKTNFSIELEGYYKKYHNIAEYRQFRDADESPENQTAAQNFYSGIGRAYGFDTYIRNRTGKFEGWIGYSLSWTEKTISSINFGNTYYPTYDRRHTITLIQDYHFNDRWRLNIGFKYGSGQPYTQATAVYAPQDPLGHTYLETLDGEINFYRLPDYHRLDIGLFYTKQYTTVKYEFFAQVVNAYSHKNVWYKFYQTYNNPVTIKDVTMLPLIPTFGVSIFF